MKVLVCADVHLDNFKNFAEPTDNQLVNSRLKDSLDALEEFFQYGVDHNISTYVINGDLFNQRSNINPSMYAYCVTRVFEMIGKTNQGTLIINPGNHDQSGRDVEPNSLSIFKDYNANGCTIKVIDKKAQWYDHMLFVPYTEDTEGSKTAVRDALNSVDESIPVIVFAHLGLNNVSQGRWEHKVSGSYNINDLGWGNSSVKAINLGHYHTRVFMQGSDNSDERSAWYTGSLLPINFNDVDKNGVGTKRGFDVIDTETGSHEFVPITDNYPQFIMIDMDNEETLSDTELSLMESNYVQVTVHSTKQQDYLKTLDKDKYNFKIKLDIPIAETVDLDIDSDFSTSEIVSSYCSKYYPDIKDMALSYLGKVREESM